MADEKKLRQIRALLDRAAHENTPQAEAEAATAKAMELMAEYGISEAMVDAAGPRKDQITTRVFQLQQPYTYEKGCLVGWLAEALRCQTTWRHYGSVITSVTVMGFESDVERVDLLYTSLLLQATRGVMQAEKPWYEDNTTRFRKNWLTGFAQVVASRVRAIEADAVRAHDATGSGSAELVLADRAALVKRAFAEQNPKLKSAKSRRRGGVGLDEGQAAGRSADIGQSRVGAGQGRAIAGGA